MTRARRVFGLAAAGALAALLSGCADLGLGGAPITPPSPLLTARDPESAGRAIDRLVETFRDACLRADFELSDAPDRATALGLAPAPPAGDFERFEADRVILELRRGPSRPMQASNCLVWSPIVTPREARAAATRALGGSGIAYEAIGPAEARELSPDGAVVGLVDGAGFDGLARVINTVKGGKSVAGVAYLRTR